MRKHRFHSVAGTFALLALTTGCVITDYGGIPAHKTSAEAKLWGTDIAFSGFAPDLDGTYAYTVKYDNANANSAAAHTIFSYLNPVFASFTRDGLVDQDGDYVQGSAGTAGGKFNNQFVAKDPTPGGACEFFSNVTQDKSSTGPLLALCDTGFGEEVDRDDLGEDFASLDDLFSQIWSGSLSSSFTADVVGITLNGTPVSLTNALSISMKHNGTRPMQIAIDASSPGGQEMLQAILDNTVHGEATSVGLDFSGGLSTVIPGNVVMAFNHDGIAAVLQ